MRISNEEKEREDSSNRRTDIKKIHTDILTNRRDDLPHGKSATQDRDAGQLMQ